MKVPKDIGRKVKSYAGGMCKEYRLRMNISTLVE
jgi:hypothetical protein